MTRVWKWNRPVTVREVLEDLQQGRSIAYTTVMTVLDNLHQKGWVRREAEGRAYRYEAVSTRAAYAAALMNDAWSQSDNAAAALVAFFGMMSEEQRQALRDAVRIVSIPETEPVRGAEPAEAANTRPDTTDNGADKTPDNQNERQNRRQNEDGTDNPAAPVTDISPENPDSAPEASGR